MREGGKAGSWHVGKLAMNLGILEIGDDENGKRQATLNIADYRGREAEMWEHAYLIAAAQDLLKALKDVRDNAIDDSPYMWERVDAAIAMAKIPKDKTDSKETKDHG